ncbi:hypothetical protein TWF281_001833 [Arthrobotrys megalospora]
MARRVTLPQSQAPYRPSHAPTAPTTVNAEPHNLRGKSPVGYGSGSEDSPPATQSSTSDGNWYSVKRITAERRKKGKKEYKVEWDGVDEYNKPWPQEWKPWNEVTTTLVEEWEERKAGKKRGRESSSSSPVPEVGVSKPVRVAQEDIERYRRGRKRLRKAKDDPIVISSSSEEEPEVTEEQRQEPVEEDDEVEVEGDSGDDVGPLVTKSRRRRIVESSQSTLNRSQPHANDEEGSQSLSEKLVAVEIPVREDLDLSLYIPFPRPSSAVGDMEGELVQAPLSISSLEEELDNVGEDGERFAEITIFGRSDEDDVQIQVPRTQSSVRERREIPDSQSSGATSLHLTPADQRPVPETPLNSRPTVVHSPAEQLQLTRLIPIQEIGVSVVEPGPPVSDPEVGNDFEDIPDSSNRVFSQDVRELKSQEAQSQSSKESQQSTRSQQSHASLPSAQLSFGKVGVTPSFHSFPETEELKALDDAGPKPVDTSTSISTEAPAVVARKSVAGEASAFSHPDQPFRAQTSSNLEQLTATNLPRRTQQSVSTDNDSFATPNSFPEGSTDDAPELATAPEHPVEPLASHRLTTIRILQEAVESRPEDIVDSDSELPIQPAQLENTPSYDQRQGEATEPSNLPQLRNLEPYEPAGRNPNLLHPSLDNLSPRTPIQEEDPLQGGRSASSTPCGPIPASARPTPVTVLGYFPSQRSAQKSSLENEERSPNSVISSSAALYQAVSAEYQEKPNLRSNEDIMSAGPVSPLLKVADIAAAPEHRLSPQRQIVATRSSGLLSSSLSESPVTSHHAFGNLTSDPGAVSAREKTPVAEALPIIDDEYLAASQALQLLQTSTRSALNEIFLPIPLTENQRRIYQETLLDRYREVEAFYGINNTQNQGGDITLEMIENIVCDLDRISSHWELSEGRSYTTEDEGPKLVKWFRKQSSKFDFLFRILKKLRNESYSVALVLQAGMLMEYADVFLRSAGYQFTRFSAERGPEAITPTPEAQRLRLLLVPSCEMTKEAPMPSVNLVIAVDSSLDSSRLHIQQLRSIEESAPTQAPVLHLIPINTVAHIRQYLPQPPGILGRDLIRDHLNPILYAAILVRDHVGILPPDLQNRLDALSSNNVFSWLENVRAAEGNILPSLPLKSQDGQRETPASQRASLSASPARKRIHSQSAIPSAASAKNKRPRIEVDQTSPRRSGDTPMLDSDGVSGKLGNVTEDPMAKEPEKMPSAAPASDISGAITNVKNTETANLVEQSSDGLETGEKDIEGAQGLTTDIGEEDENEIGGGEEETDEEILNRLSKDEVVSLLLEYQNALWESKLHADEFEKHTSNREIDYQEQREKVIELKQTLRWQEAQIETLTEQRDKFKTDAEQAIRDRELARDELRRFQEALKDSEEGESERVKIMVQNMELNGRINSLERKRQSVAHEADFIRDQYQRASQGTSLLIAEKNQLEEQVEDLARQADKVKVQLKEMNMDRERSEYLQRIKELTAKLDRANRQIAMLEVEKKRVERTRGLQTRASSIPPRGAQSSPVPTRPGSPLTTTHRGLRNSESA